MSNIAVLAFVPFVIEVIVGAVAVACSNSNNNSKNSTISSNKLPTIIKCC